ncbi:hypothetical protein H0H87_006593, partial [Tephrocybe sp. NHM501043]
MKDDNRQLIPDLNIQIQADLDTIETRSKLYFESHFPLPFQFPIENFIQANPYDLFLNGRMATIGKLENEIYMATYLNTIIAGVQNYHLDYELSSKRGTSPLRYWSAGHRNKTIGIGPWRAKPDLVLVQLYDTFKLLKDDEVFWPDVLAVGEATVTSGPTERMEQSVNTRSFLMSYTQGDRRFSLALSFRGATWTVHITDRQGRISIGPWAYETHTKEFVQLLIILSYGDVTYLGLDHTMTRKARTPNLVRSPIIETLRCYPDMLQSEMQPDAFLTQFAHTFNYRYKNLPIPPPQTELIIETVYSFASEEAAEEAKPSPADLNRNLVGKLATISCKNRTYEVIGELFKSEALFGRGTRVWHTKGPDGHAGTIKDSNVLKSRRRTEAAILQYINACSERPPYIPILIDSEVLDHSDLRRENALFVPDVTGLTVTAAQRHKRHLSEAAVSSEMNHREQRRLVFDNVGEDLGFAKSVIELLGVFLDITKAIKFLGAHNIVHRDISYNNILLREMHIKGYERPAFGGGVANTLSEFVTSCRVNASCRPGLLIDFDFAGFLDPHLRMSAARHQCPSNSSTSTAILPAPSVSTSNPITDPPMNQGNDKKDSGARTGTAPFMALPLLLHSAPHTIGFDLESLFYVLVFFCTHFQDFNVLRDGKGILVRDNHYAPISAWFNPLLSFVDLGHLKASQVHLHMELSILRYISSDFDGLKPIMRKLWRALYPSVQSVSNRSDLDPTSAAFLEISQLQPQDACDDFIAILEQAIEHFFHHGDASKRMPNANEQYDEADYATSTLPSPRPSKRSRSSANASASP